MSGGNNTAILMELIRLAMMFPELAREFQDFAKGKGITEEQWEQTKRDLEEHNPQFLYPERQPRETPLAAPQSAPEPQTTQTQGIYYEWFPVKPERHQLMVGDSIVSRQVRDISGMTRIEYMVVAGNDKRSEFLGGAVKLEETIE